MLERIKLALRIAHTNLDSELNELIAAAQAELIRVGVTASAAASTSDELIVQAVKTYVLMNVTDDNNTAVRLNESWRSQLDNLRKTAAYNTEVTA